MHYGGRESAGLDVVDVRQGVGDGLDQTHCGLGTDSGGDMCSVVGMVKGDSDTVTMADLVQESVGSAVDIETGDDMVTGFKQSHCAMGRGHSRSEGWGAGGIF